MSGGRINLVLIPENGMTGPDDCRDIARRINARQDRVAASVCLRRHVGLLQWRYALRPSLYVAWYEAKRFRPVRGVCRHGLSMSKSRQYRVMEAAGIPVLPWTPIEPGRRYAVADWGKFAIVKPDVGARGRDVRIRRTGRVRYEKDCAGDVPHLLQKFAYTGADPVSYRVLTFFGEPLLAHRNENPQSDDVHVRIGGGADGELGGYNPVATSASGRVVLDDDPEILQAAVAVATRAFPDIPVLGIDLVRDAASGRVYCLEANPYGSTWHFSSETGRRMQAANAIDFQAQFGAFDRAADILIAQALRLAR